MTIISTSIHRRALLVGASATIMSLAFASPARAAGLTDILAMASDSALDKLAKPGAFYDDEDIRISIPLIGSLSGLGEIASRTTWLLGKNSTRDIVGDLTRTVNDAASAAAGEAKPIFRESIGQLSITDAPGIISKNDGGTRYLKESAGETLHEKLRPLMDAAMTELGAYTQLDNLGKKSDLVKQVGLTSDKLGESVTEQALDGIFKYIGNEEANFRANPLEKAGGILKDIFN